MWYNGRMKRLYLLTVFLFFTFFGFAQTKIGSVEYSNILEITKSNNDVIYTFVEEQVGLISIRQDFYCVINGKKYGPFSKQPDINVEYNYYFVEVQRDGNNGYIIDDSLFGPYEELDEVQFSLDGKSYCFIYSENDEYYLIEDGKVVDNKPYISDSCYSPTGNLCYIFGEYIDDKLAVFIKVKDKSFGPYTNFDKFEFAENGDYYIEVEVDEEDDFVLCNGKLYSEDDFDDLYFTLDFSNIKIDSEGFYYSDGKNRSPSFDTIEKEEIKDFIDVPGNFVFTAIKDGLYYLIKNITEVYGPYSKVSTVYTYLEPSTEKLYYNVEHDGLYLLYREGEKLADSTRLIYPYFSKNGKTCCYMTQTSDKKEYLIAGDEKIGPLENLSGITVSDDGSKIVYSAEINGSEYVFEGIKKYGPYKDTSDISISPDNSLAFSYEDDNYNSFIFYRGQTYGPYKNVNSSFLADISFSSDGKHIASYVEFYGSQSKYIFLDGDTIGEIEEGEVYSEPCFSKNGEHTLCITYKPNYIYVDGKKINGSNGGTASFTEYGIVSYIESENNKKVYHLIINSNDYIGTFLENDFIYIDGKNIMLLKK